MQIKDVIMGGGILPALYKENEAKQDAKDAEIEALKKQSQGPAGTQAVAGQGMKRGGKVSSASSRADGCATKGKTRGKVL